MVKEKNSKLFILGIFPKCPFYKPVTLLIILILIGFGTWGISYLNLWVAVAYSIYSLLFYFLIMPLTMCKYCYFKVKDTSIDKEKGKTVEKLLTVEKWSKSHLHMQLIIISFFIDFSIFAVIALIGFIAMVGGNGIYMLRVKCASCPIREECHSSF
jgi:hypothetical protein